MAAMPLSAVALRALTNLQRASVTELPVTP
jgi:hypothetical protein